MVYDVIKSKIIIMKLYFKTLKFYFSSFIFYWTLVCVHAQVQIFTPPSSLKPASDFEVKINGKEVFVYESPIPASYCSFNMDGPVEIIIKTRRDLKWVDIRPLSLGLKATFKDSTITIKMSKPSKISVELNGSIKSPLFIFANPPEINKPNKKDPNVIFFEAGKIHYPGIIKLISNQSLYIEGGAIVVGVVESENSKHVKISGRGILDGSYNHNFNDSIIKTGNLSLLSVTKIPGSYHRSIEFKDCEDISIEGITLHNSTSWQITPIHCNQVKIENIKIISDQASDDGIDIVRSRNVLITNSFIRTKDDCIAIKANMEYPPSEGVDNVLVENCVFWNALWGNGLEIGFELYSSEVKNITFRNSDIIHVESNAALSIHNSGSAVVSNVLYDNIRIENVGKKLFDLAIFRSRYSIDGVETEEEMKKLYLHGAWDGVLQVPSDKKNFHAKFRGYIKNITFRNISLIDCNYPYSIFNGYNQDKNINGVKIENLVVNGKKITDKKNFKSYIENTENITVK